jgi:alpha-L-fucosidase
VKVKTPEQLVDLYFRSVGRGASFLLNVPPDRRGRLHENDVAALEAYGKILRNLFAVNHAQGKVRDGMVETIGEFNVVRIREDIRLGQRVDAFVVEASIDGGWKQLAEGTSIGSCRLIRLPEKVRAAKVRVRALRFSAEPRFSELSLHTL